MKLWKKSIDTQHITPSTIMAFFINKSKNNTRKKSRKKRLEILIKKSKAMVIENMTPDITG